MAADRAGKNTGLARWFLPLVSGLLAVTFIVFADYVTLPMHLRGTGQSVTAWINGLSRLLQLPGLFVAGFLGLWSRGHIARGAWIVMLAVSFPLYAIVAALLRWIWASHRPAGARIEAVPTGEQLDVAGKSSSKRHHPTRRQFLMAAPRLGVIGAAAVGGYAFAIEPRRPVITRRIYPLRGLPQELDGLTIVQLTDIHHGPWMSLSAVTALVQTTNGLRPDIIALTGDYVHQSGQYIDPVIAELGALRARIGVVAVLGNHDWWEGKLETQRAFERAQIPLIDNRRLFVTTGGTLRSSAASGLCIAGVDDLWQGEPDYHAALDGVPQSMPRILLSHNPDVAEERRFLAGAWRVDLMLSGHTHGGQIHIPGLGTPMIPSRYGQKYASGLVQGPACPVFVCRGIGTTIMPLRLGVPPEIAVIKLKSV